LSTVPLKTAPSPTVNAPLLRVVHAKNIYDKLHANGRTQAIRRAKLSGLFDPPQ